MSESIDLLAVLDGHISYYVAIQQLARDEGNHHYADELDEHCGTLTQLREARASVAELIEAAELLRMLATTDDEFPDWPAGWDWDRISSALSNVRGAA